MKTHQRVLHPIDNRSGVLVSRDKKDYIDFSSNDYFGYSQDPELLEKINQKEWTQFGATGSRLLGGDYQLIHEIEKACANLVHKESSLFFNSGYQLNSGVIPCLFSKEDVIIADKLVHASLIDGSLKSGANCLRYRHNDINHLEQLLIKHRSNYSNCVIISDSIFSMDGDTAPLKKLIELKQTFNTELYIDEAHALGIIGQNGEGLISKEDAPYVDYIIGTFGKTLGSSGAFIACSEKNKQTLINACRSFIYSTSLPLPILEFNKLALEKIKHDHSNRKALDKLSNYTRDKLKTLPFKVIGNTHIIPIVIGDQLNCINYQNHLEKQGLWAQSIHHPTVPKGESRLRLSLSSNHTTSMIDSLISTLKNV